MAAPAATQVPAPRSDAADLTAVLVCSVIWGTTWYAITLQLGTVPAVASIVYRFGLASLLLFGWCLVRRESLRLTPGQHLAVFGQGLFTFAIDYAFVYFSEERIASAVVAVIFAGLAFLNLVAFRLVLGQKAARLAWIGAFAGLTGVGVMSYAEIARAGMDPRAAAGLAMAVVAVVAAVVGNLFAWRGQKLGVPVGPATAWAMFYGTALLAVYGFATGLEWSFEWTASYVLSLLHLSVFGSVTAFLLYFLLARRRGYGFAAYISALTPPVAMVMSVAFEGARFGLAAFGGLALVLLGQWLLIRAKN
ncbi:MAG TPA: EamA family transporter [Caulobacteraceae bacterium]|nr:EamA family transporter [Caulobacteraceae bacterium]